jgi:hypothetical protein
MKEIPLPKFWFRPHDEIDQRIAEKFPYVCEMRRDVLDQHYEITLEYRAMSDAQLCSWRGPTFYFKDKSDAVMFKLKWG